jgi:N-acetylmuramoyl-L-alanine amidase
MVVIHYTGMTSAEAAAARLCDPRAEVSAHWLIAEDGRLWRLVDEESRAWHAGAGRWGGAEDVNSRSIGVELANPGPLAAHPPFPRRRWLLWSICSTGSWRVGGSPPSG